MTLTSRSNQAYCTHRLAPCSFRWFIVAESTVRWFVAKEKHSWTMILLILTIGLSVSANSIATQTSGAKML
jgi:hypothetical protein